MNHVEPCGDRNANSIRNALALRVVFFSIFILAIALPASAQVNVTTYQRNNQRTGVNSNETILTPANVNVNTFGKLFSQTVDGYVFAQPLYLTSVVIPGKGTHNVVYVATEHDSVYAFDADNNTGANAPPLWQTSFLSAGVTTVPSDSTHLNVADINPEVGITGTPVIDTSTGTLYVVAETLENSGTSYVKRLHALDITTGAEKFGGPVVISASVSGTGDGTSTVKFVPQWENQRPGLLLYNGVVYIGFSSHGDNSVWHGWVLGYNASNLSQTFVYCVTPNGTSGGIWMSGQGLAMDTGSNLFFATGNGTYDGTSLHDYGDSIVRIDLSIGPTVQDSFTPSDQAALSSGDVDLGSGGVAILPVQTGPNPDLLVEAGKQGNIYVVNRDPGKMGGYSSQSDNIVQELDGAVQGMWSSPLFFNGKVYFWGSSDKLKAFSVSNSLLSTTPTDEGTVTLGFPASQLAVSANGTANAIIWAIETDTFSNSGPGEPEVLQAFNAENLAGGTLYYSAANTARDNAGGAIKFAVPTVANGKVYVGAEGQLSVFGLLGSVQQAATPQISPASKTFTGSVSVTITDSTSGSTIYYTTDGTTPNPGSGTTQQYSAPFTVTSTSTVNAVATAAGDSSSAVASVAYTQQPTSSPVISPASETFTNSVLVSMTDSNTGNPIVYYTTDGTTPKPNSGTTTQYSAAFTLTSTATVQALAVATGYANSALVSAVYTLQSSQGSNPSNVISIDFVGLGSPMASSEVAGVVAKSNWNQANGAKSTAALPLLDETGTATGATVTWTSDDVWDESITDQPGNVRMMKGYLDNGQQDTSIVTVTGLPANSNGYAVYVYADGQSTGNTGTGIYQISGTGITTTSISLTYNSDFNGTFTQANNSFGNFVVFTINATAFTLSAIPSTASNGYERAPINGIQIVPNPDFTLSTTPSTASVAQGSSATFTVNVGAVSGFTGTVNLSVSGLPTGTTSSFSPSSIANSGSSTLTIATTTGTPVGSPVLTITGTSGSLTHTATVTLNVTAAPDFTVSATPSSQTVAQGSSTSYTVNVAAVNGFSGSVALSASGLPTGATSTFNPTSINAGTSSILTITAAASTPTGSPTLTITGTSGSLTHTATVTLNVTAVPNFTVSATPSSQMVTQGSSTSYTVNVAAVNGFSGSVALSASGLPTGATSTFNPTSINTGTSSILTITTAASTPTGSPTLTITGTSGSLTHTATVTLTVNTGTTGGSSGVISIDFVGLGTPMASSEVAGVVPKSNWNQASGAKSTVALPLLDETGTATGATVTWTSDDVWDESITDQPGNVRMMKGYLDNSQQDTSVLSVTGLPANSSGYTVYVYADGQASGGSNTGTYQISGAGITTTSTSLTYTTNFSGTFTQANNSIGNYVVFTINATAFTLSAIPGAATNGYERAPINGIQIVPNSDFTLSATPNTFSVAQGSSATYTVNVGALNGFSGTVSLNVSGLPTGATSSFSPTSIATSGSSTLTIATTTGTPVGSPVLTITGTSGSLTLTSTVTLDVTSSGSASKVISINFVGLGTTMASSEVAGVVAKSNWNQAAGASSTSARALVDETGSATTAAVTWKSDDVWSMSITDQPGNVRMMEGYLDNGEQNTSTVTVTGLPADSNGYTVYVYADGQSAGSTHTGTYQISGSGIVTTSVNLSYNANFNGTFVQANNSIGNYMVFTINATSFTLSAIPGISSNGYERAPINGIQIVPR